MIELTGSKSKIAFLDLPVDDPVQRRPDSSLAAEFLSWFPKIELEDNIIRL